MSTYSANRRSWAEMGETPMHVAPEILARCRREIEPPLKALLRRVLLPLVGYRLKIRKLGEGVHWGPNCRVAGAAFGNFSSFGHSAEFNGPVVIGDLTMLSTNVQVIGQDHGIANPTTPMRLDFPDTQRPVTIIEADCWIGSRVTIMEGVRIGRGSVIGSGAIVTKDIPPYSVALGSPARVVRTRFSDAERAAYDNMMYGSLERTPV